MFQSPSVFIVDDDDSTRKWCEEVLREVGVRCVTFSSAQDFFGSNWQQDAKCVLLDATIPLDDRKSTPQTALAEKVVCEEATTNPSSAQLHDGKFEVLAKVLRGVGSMPVIILSHDRCGVLVRNAFLSGAQDFLVKPLEAKELQKVVGNAVARKNRRTANEENNPVDAEIRKRLDLLTPREFEVLGELLRGMSIKQLAVRFEISIQTAAKHRARVFHKMRIENEVQLIHLLGRCWQQIYADIVI